VVEKIKLAIFPKFCYFLVQENGDYQEKYNRKGDY
jgi:hypothetical protein